MTFITRVSPTDNLFFSRLPARRQSRPEDDRKMYFFLQAAAAKPAQYTGTYQANATGYQASYAQPAAQTTIAAQPTTQAKRKFKNAHTNKKTKRICRSTLGSFTNLKKKMKNSN
jgi:hypothetical protein